jgi:hypothetical protein
MYVSMMRVSGIGPHRVRISPPSRSSILAMDLLRGARWMD